MMKYVLEVLNGQKNTAGQKAKEDIVSILDSLNFKKIKIKIGDSKLQKLLFAHKNVRSSLKNLKSNDIIVIQYPMYSRYTLKVVLEECKRRNIKTIGILHDVESLRWTDADEKVKNQELNLFKKFNSLIVHNSVMHGWLSKRVGDTPMIDLDIFDYINDKNFPEINREKNLVFAGNLEKSTFLKKWNSNKKVTVYGIKPSPKYPDNVAYKGVKTPDELPEYLSGSFGLVWDGDSLSTNNGIFGEYTRYNNPHKVSLYLSCGLPVIVWKEAAVAKFVQENKLGLTVSNMDELKTKLQKLSEQEYETFLKNSKQMSMKIRNGYFTEKAIDKAINIV
ncbi:hypothetical protein GRI00_02760 [Pediococcus pentosaceus]|nr:hypothetical protein GRI00_02760 [Pediococcus pentosaceus]